uniref:hypothetical protein n=1 Tax=Fulvivirga sp. TaxID=1931237 RepID=UPI004049BFDF
MKISKSQLQKLIIADYESKNRLKKSNWPERYEEWDQLPKVILPNKINKKFVQSLYDMGMLCKSELIDQQYYLGSCRNAMVAKWEAKENFFMYMRIKFSNIFPEGIRHPEDDNGYDLFLPFNLVIPRENEIII